MHGRVIGTFFIPAVVENTTAARDWRYNGWRVLVTEGAHPDLVKYLANVQRS